MTTIDTPTGIASFIRHDMREEAVLIAAQLRETTERIRSEIERAHVINAETETYFEAALESVKAAGISGIQPIDGLFYLVSALTGGDELHAALSDLKELADPDTR